MFAYIVRKIAYAIPILLGVNLLLFGVFFFVYSPDDLAETYLGDKRITQEQKDNWKQEHGYHLPRVLNLEESGTRVFTETIFSKKSMPLFLFRFGKSDLDGSSIGDQMRERIPKSLAITIPIFLIGLPLGLCLAMLVAFYRATYLDTWALVLSVILMSISSVVYILAAQYAIGYLLRLTPVSGFDAHPLYGIKFMILPVTIGVVAGLGGNIRYYRTIFLEEINKDYIRTARAKGLNERKVLFKHALKNAMIPILTSVVVTIPFLIIGSLLLERFFGIPGLGDYLIDAITKQDFAVVRAMVFLGSFIYVISLVLVDISYTIVDPRVRLE